VKIQAIAAVYYAAFRGYRRVIILLYCLIRPGIIGAVGIAKKLYWSLQSLLKAMPAFPQFHLDFLCCKSR